MEQLTMSDYKVWELVVDSISNNDAIWLKSASWDVRVSPLTDRVSTLSGYSELCTGHQIVVITTCEKQESMLKLKYGDRLVLKSVIISRSDGYEDFNLVSHSG
jgi:hypothetical protein